MHTKTQLRSWAIQADALATGHYTHRFRDKLIHALYLQITHYQHLNRPLWQDTLMSMCEPLIGSFPVSLDHNEVKAQLFLIRDTCLYLAKNLDDTWYEWLNDVYDHSGNVQRDHSTRPIEENPFSEWADSNLNDDGDLTDDGDDSRPDFPFFPHGL